MPYSLAQAADTSLPLSIPDNTGVEAVGKTAFGDVGSALDIFGGKLPDAEVVAWSQEVSKQGGGGEAEPGAP